MKIFLVPFFVLIIHTIGSAQNLGYYEYDLALIQSVLEEKQRQYDNQYRRQTYQQLPTCNEAANSIINYGRHLKSVSTYSSNWIKSAEAYSYQNNLYVFVHTKQNNSYIFCSVPVQNWNNFVSNTYTSYGKKYHAYIEPYKCNCR